MCSGSDLHVHSDDHCALASHRRPGAPSQRRSRGHLPSQPICPAENEYVSNLYICIVLYLNSYLAIALHIGALVEVREEEVEHDRMSANEVGKTDGIVAIVLEEQLERVHHNQNKLYHLHDCQVFLPPQITLYFGSHCGQHIVGVHEDVHEGVQEPKECRVSTWGEFNAPPDRNGHNTMMNDMQCGDLIVSFAHHEEERIEELGELGEIVPPAAPCSLRRERKRKPYKLYALHRGQDYMYI